MYCLFVAVVFNLIVLPFLFVELMGKYMCPVHECIYTGIMKCNYFIRDDLFGNIVLSGGNMVCCYEVVTLVCFKWSFNIFWFLQEFPGMCERMGVELSVLAPSTIKVNVQNSGTRKHAVWLGGSQLASIQMFPKMWVSKSEYDESGPSIMNRKCF